MVKKDVVWILLFFLLIFAIRLPSSIKSIIDWDETPYFIAGQDLVNGEILYKTCWGPRGPILYFLFAPVIWLFSNNIFVLRIFTTLYLLVTMLFIYLIAKRLFTGKISLIPPLIYGLFFSDKKFGGLASNGELFMMLPAIIATLFFVNYIQDKKYSSIQLWLCGFFSGVAIFIKQSVFFSVIIFLVVLIFKKIKLRQYSWNLFSKEILWYLFGGLTISLIVLSYFVYHNCLFEFYHAFYWVNTRYVASVSAMQGVKNWILFLHNTIRHDHDLTTILALGTALFFLFKKRYIEEKQKNIAYFIIGLSIFSMFGVCLGRNMYSHYFLQMGLPLSLLVGLGISLIEIDAKDFNRIFYIGVVIVILATVPKRHLARFVADYKNHRDNIYYKISEYIKGNTTKQDTIFLLGDEPLIYFLSERRAPTKYMYWLSHYGRWGKILQIRDSTLLAFSTKSPKYIIYHEHEYFEAERIEHLEEFMLDNYHIETKFGDHILYRLN